jgi:hypothetical protein
MINTLLKPPDIDLISGKGGKKEMNSPRPSKMEKFIIDLTRAKREVVHSYLADITRDTRFYSGLEANQRAAGAGRYSGDFSVGVMLGRVLYAICRAQQPDNVIETGVASGVSSSYLLCSLEQNGHGQLYSIDKPWWPGFPSGWKIPDYLRTRWHLIRGESAGELPPLLAKIKEIDIFLHDSDHNYQNLLWEYKTAWEYLKPGRILLSHNIDANNAFRDFCQSSGTRGYFLTNMGGTVKI